MWFKYFWVWIFSVLDSAADVSHVSFSTLLQDSLFCLLQNTISKKCFALDLSRFVFASCRCRRVLSLTIIRIQDWVSATIKRYPSSQHMKGIRRAIHGKPSEETAEVEESKYFGGPANVSYHTV